MCYECNDDVCLVYSSVHDVFSKCQPKNTGTGDEFTDLLLGFTTEITAGSVAMVADHLGHAAPSMSHARVGLAE